MSEQGHVDGWASTVEPNEAVKHPSGMLCAFEESADWRDGARFVATEPRGELPSSFDWRELGGCTPIRYQSVCGAAWAFATVGVLESAILIHDGVETNLSERWLIDCNQQNWGCSRGGVAFDYFLASGRRTDPCGDSGAVLEADLPYVAGDLSCECPFPHAHFIRSWAYVAAGQDVPEVDDIKQAILDYGPVLAGVRVVNAFWDYEEGVYGGTACDDGPPNHMVMLVGWDDALGTNGAWILRNSWGTGWGEQGYMYIEYGCSQVGYHACFVEYLGDDPLWIAPLGGLRSAATSGDVAEPSCQTYTLSNRGNAPLTWQAENSQAWLDLSPSDAQVLAPDESADLHVCVNESAKRLRAGVYRDAVSVTNLDTGAVQVRPITLSVVPAAVYVEPMDVHPGWAAEGAWVFGVPQGECEDPAWTHTGERVYGYNLAGCYDANRPEYTLTAAPVDCSACSAVVLEFWRWLTVKSANEDHARVQVSTDGVHWTDVWVHRGVGIVDGVWRRCRYDISPMAAGRPTVYVRWGMGPTGRPYPAGGWNIDDVAVLGEGPDWLSVSPAGGFAVSAHRGGAFEPTTAVYTLENTAEWPLDWTASRTADWINLSATGGRLGPGETASLQLSLNAGALLLPPGTDDEAVVFANLTSGRTQRRAVTLSMVVRPGRMAVTDSVRSPYDHAVAFGPVIVGTERSETVTVANVDDRSRLEVTAISLGDSYAEGFQETPLNWAPPRFQSASAAGRWQVHEGQYLADVGAPDLRTSSAYTARTWQDLAVQVTMRIPEGRGQTGVLFARCSPDFDWSVPRGSAYAVGVAASGEYWLGRYVDGAFSFLQPWRLLPELTGGASEYTVVLSMAGPAISVYLNGTRAWSGVDEAIPEAGRVALGAYSGGDATAYCAFDDLLVGWPVPVDAGTPVPFAPPSAFELLEVPALPHSIPAGGRLLLHVRCAPLEETFEETYVRIRSNDPNAPEVAVSLSVDAYVPVHITHVPLGDTTDLGPYTVAATITARYGLRRAALNWRYAGEDAFRVVPMAPAGDEQYAAAIPRQTIGSTIGYYIECEDSRGGLTAAPIEGAYCFEVRGIPNLVATPARLAFVLPPDATEIAQVILENTGNWPTQWQVDLTPTHPEPACRAPQFTPAEKRALPVDWTAPHALNALLVGFRPGTGKAARGAAHGAAGGQVVHRFKFVPVEVVRLPAKTSLRAAAAAYAESAAVAYVEPNYRVRAAALPNDERFGELWGLHNVGQTGGTPDADIDAPEAWDFATGDREVVVGVIDSGIDYTHEDLADNLWTNALEAAGAPGVDDDGNGIVDDVYGAAWVNVTGAPSSGDPMDDTGHGTHVAGTIGAVGGNGIGVAGVNWSVRLMALRFLDCGFGYTADAMAALEYALDHGVRITSNSWGGGPYSQAFADLLWAAGEAGMLFVAAAGNDAMNTDISPYYPACFDAPTIISVASSDEHDARSSFSNWGPTTVDLAAPGSQILSALLGDAYGLGSGTSMATPHVSGVAALLLSRDRRAEPAELKEWILSTVDPLPQWSGLTLTGGRLNAVQAVLVAGVPWLSVAPEEGLLDPAERSTLTVTADTAGLPDGFAASAQILFAGDPDGPVAVDVDLVVAQHALVVTPPLAFESRGQEGETFYPERTVYRVMNAGDAPLSWTLTLDAQWLELADGSGGGALLPGDAEDLTVQVSGRAATLPYAFYEGAIRFEDTTNGVVAVRPATLAVRKPPPNPFFSEPLDQDPGWRVEGDWAFGRVQGACYDPEAAHTGDYVYGTNLAGCYPDDAGEYFLTTTPIDCTGYTDVTLRFWRWLSMESAHMDWARIQASADGTHWQDVWYHVGDTFAETAWRQVCHDISGVADEQPTVYIRWGMGDTDESFTYGGWNIDDVELLGHLIDDLAVVPSTGIVSAGSVGGPFAPGTRTYTLRNTGAKRLIWTASNASSWVVLSDDRGLLDPGQVQALEATVAGAALASGEYHDTITFRNSTSGRSRQRFVELVVKAFPGEITVTDSIPPVDDLALPLGAVVVGRERTGSVQVTNAHDTHALVIAGVDWVDARAARNAQGKGTALPFQALDLPDFPHTLPPGNRLVLNVRYAPTVDGDHEAELLIHSNDDDESTVAVYVTGETVPAGAPVITAQPVSQVVNPGEPAVFSVQAEGEDLAHLWRKDGLDLEGASCAVLEIAEAVEADEGLYVCEVSNTVARVLSDPAALTVHDLPTAAFSAEPIEGTAPLTVRFTDESTHGSSPIAAWTWSFGDGASSAEQGPEHVYEHSGAFTVSLTVTTDVGADSAVKADYIVVREAETPAPGCFGRRAFSTASR